jgi:sugar (pentulose or hexulose) kinase
VLPADLYNSIGTAEALVRVLDNTLDAHTRARLATHNVNVGAHLIPGRGVMIAGIKTGLLLRRVLQLVGVDDVAGRSRIDEAVMGLPGGGRATHALRVTGADNSDGILSVRADGDGLSPELFFAATLEHSSQTLAGVLELMDREVGPAGRTVLSGGWASMRCVQRARAEVLPRMHLATSTEGTAYGAALIAAFAAAGDPNDRDLVTFASEYGVRREAASTRGCPA